MQRETQTEVLVAGAGPVGLLTALFLAEGGVRVKIVDQAVRTAARSYACALHPTTLQLLDRLGLGESLLEVGHKIETIAFYEGKTRRSEIHLGELPLTFPFLLLLPQTDLEDILEHALQTRAKVKVEWNSRLSDVRTEDSTVKATIDKLVETAKGYIVPEWEWVVEKTVPTQAVFLVGADGANSHVRQCLGIPTERVAGPEVFAVYEFESDGKYPNEMGIVLDKDTTNVFWPLSDQRCRWSFQVAPEGKPTQFPEKETRALRVEEPIVDEETKKHLHSFLKERAPWFEGCVQTVEWSTEVWFEHQLAQRFGQGHCWLIGDAAHQTSPVGVQSMNVGMREAEALATLMIKILREDAPVALLEDFHKQYREEWRCLLGLQPTLNPAKGTKVWLKKHGAQLLPCLPASGEELRHLVQKLGFEFGSE